MGRFKVTGKMYTALIFGQATLNNITYCFYSQQFLLPFKDLIKVAQNSFQQFDFDGSL